MDRARTILAERIRRERLFPGMDEAGWLVLVDLLVAERPVSVTSACLGAFVPVTTGLRHIGLLEAGGFIRRVPDPMDGRRVFLRLTDEARELLAAFFAPDGSTPFHPQRNSPEAQAEHD